MNGLFSGTNKDKEILRKELYKIEAKFAEGEKKMNSLEKKLQKYKESKQLIRNLNRKLAYKDNQIKSQKLEIAHLKDDVRKKDEECLQLYGLVKKQQINWRIIWVILQSENIRNLYLNENQHIFKRNLIIRTKL